MTKRHCGICHEMTYNEDFCNACNERSIRMDKGIQERLKARKLESDIINQLILTAGQWKQFGEQQYSDQFDALLNQLRVATRTTEEGAVQLLEAEFKREGVAA